MWAKRKSSKFRRSLLVYGLILVFGAVVIGCAGIKHAWTLGDKVALGTMIACTAADVATTVYALDNGLREANPTFGDNPGMIIAANAVLTGTIWWAAQYLTSAKRKLLYVPAGFRCFDAVHNYQVIHED